MASTGANFGQFHSGFWLLSGSENKLLKYQFTASHRRKYWMLNEEERCNVIVTTRAITSVSN